MLSLPNYACSSQSLRRSTIAGKNLATCYVLARNPHTQQQTRRFQFDLLYSYLYRNCAKGLLRQHRTMKHKFATTLTGKLLWDREISSYSNAYGFKGFMYSALHNQDSRERGRWVKIGQLSTSRQEPIAEETQTRDWRDLNLHIQRFNANLKESVRVVSDTPAHDPLHHIRIRADLEPEPSLIRSRTSTRSELYHESLRNRFQTKAAEEEPIYRIDHITNRKVYTTTPKENTKEGPNTQTDTPVHTFAIYRSPFLPDSEKISSQAPATHTLVVSNSVQESLKEYDAKVAHYTHGALYDVSECNIDFQDAVQAGLKDYDERISTKTRQLGVYTGKRGNEVTSSTINTRHNVHKTIHHHEATSERPRELLRAILEYESKRPKFAERLLKSESKTHPLVQAIEDFGRAKVASIHQSMSDERIDPLLKSIHEYHEKLRLEQTTTEESGGVIDRQLLDVFEPIEEYQRSLSRARYHPKAVDELKEYDSKVDYSQRRRERLLHLEEEEKIEDLDLLRASDIRAASGKLEKTRVETKLVKMIKRKELENALEVSQKHQNTSADESTAFDVVKKIRSNSLNKSAISNHQVEGTTGSIDNHVLQDYQMQLMLLEQQSKKSLMMVRQEQESIIPRAGGVHGAPGAVGSNGQPFQELLPKSSIADTSSSATKSPKGLTGNFFRDFPEEFETSWRTLESGNLIPNTGSMRKGFEPKTSAHAGGFDRPGNPDALRLETSLDRAAQESAQKATLNAGRLLKLVSDIPETFQNKLESVEPKLYKILAYDPTMQTISQAETTSIVEDSANPLTPANVLLRLSSPAKFFPHFLSLQSQGYEIVSGSGDVLVFRKVRSSSPQKTELPVHEQAWSSEAHCKSITNQIDGMQRSAQTATGDYASPTGFVNHDLPRGSAPLYNIDVRREEPVFSGKSSWEEKSGEKPRRKGRGRRVLVSAVWVAGCCYAVGVVSEFFRNGSGGLEGF